ncbi:MAG: hypothetical protein AAGC73_05295 [Verrucomicrobiota bacterium]
MRFLFGILFFLSAISLSGAAPAISEIIDRARAVAGTEEDLNGLVTLQMEGRIIPSDDSMPDAQIFISARKPLSKRLEVRVGDVVETTILQGKRGCMVRSDLQMSASKMRLLTPPEMAHVTLSTKQFFNFYRPDTRNGEQVSHQGVELLQGMRCHKLVYLSVDGTKTTRYFSLENDALVASISNSGVVSVPLGAQRIGGIRYPESIEYYENNEKLHTIVFDRIGVNKPLPAGLFAIPKSQEK